MTHKEMNGVELLAEYKTAIENLPGSGAAGRQWVADVEAELLERLENPEERAAKYRINQLEGEALTAAILNVEQYHEKREGVPPQNIAKSIWYAVNEGLQFDRNGKIWGR